MIEFPAGVQRPEGMNIIGAEDLFAPLPPVDWLCQSLRIAPGAPTLFAGYGYSGKSVALQGLALSVASGCALWGAYSCRRGRVIHLDYEQGKRITACRYQRLAYAEEVDPRSLTGWLECGVLPSRSLDADVLCRLGENRSMALVDSWRAAHPEVDENSSEVRKTLDAMGTASEKTGCAFLPLAHSRKPQRDAPGGGKMAIRGSSGFYDGCQTVYVFDGQTVGSPMVELQKDRLGGESMPPFVLSIVDVDGREGLRVRRQDVPTEEREPFEKTCQRIVEFLIEHPGVPGADVLASKMGVRKGSLVAPLQSLEAEGVIVRVKATGRGNGVRLFHSDSVPEVAPF